MIVSTDEFENRDLVNAQFTLLDTLANQPLFGLSHFGLIWLHGMIDFIKDKNTLDADVQDSHVLRMIEVFHTNKKGLMDYLCSSASELDPHVRREIGYVWKDYLGFFCSNRRGEPSTSRLLSLMLQRLNDIDPGVRKVFFECLCNLDPFDSLLGSDGATDDDIVVEFKHLVMRAPSSGSFRQKQFQVVASYLGMSEMILDAEKIIFHDVGLKVEFQEWLPDMYYACQSEYILNMVDQTSTPLLSVAAISSECMMFWALWETARFLIISRLQTPLGSPTQVYLVLTRLLERLKACWICICVCSNLQNPNQNLSTRIR